MDDRRREDFAKALFVLDNQNPREKRPPRCEPRVQPVNGIVQPPVMPPPNRKGRVTNFLLKLRTAVNALSRNPSSLHFRRPVDAVKLNIRDYYEKIANPMDLNTIKKRFEYTYYWGGADVLEDILLIFENCRTYNSPDSTVFKAAVTLCECFWLRMAKMQQELHKECRAEAKTRRPRKASISKTSPLPKTPRQEKAVIPKKTNVEIEDLNQPKADDPLPSFEAVPNQHPNRHHCKQFTPVTPARRGRGRPPGPPSQKAVVETEPYEEDDSLRIITTILGKTQLMHYLQPPDISIPAYVDTHGDCRQLWDSNVDDLTSYELRTVIHIALQHNVPVTTKNGRMELSITKFSPKVISILNEAILQSRRLDSDLLPFMTADELQVMTEVLENRLLKLNTLLNISNRSGTLSRHATPSNGQDLEPSGLATMAKMARLSDDEEEEKGGGKHVKKGET
ncbi:bromodomain testis-specific protein-like [Drosophila subobscura]|uniref:bromodomain testis-specific protein-like n=1 Tax=Drosophila subobscura TaxID=7241 RepID=UPI00155A1EB0|nr:bromodomain testis-specific protein-like [Drosophila subobscura]